MTVGIHPDQSIRRKTTDNLIPSGTLETTCIFQYLYTGKLPLIQFFEFSHALFCSILRATVRQYHFYLIMGISLPSHILHQRRKILDLIQSNDSHCNLHAILLTRNTHIIFDFITGRGDVASNHCQLFMSWNR